MFIYPFQRKQSLLELSLSLRNKSLRRDKGNEQLEQNLPLASGLGRSTGITGSHGAGRGREGSGAERADGSRLGEGCAKHLGRREDVLWFGEMVWWQLKRGEES